MVASQKHVDKKHKKRKRRDKSVTPPSRRAHPHPVAPMPFYPGYPWMPWPGMYMPRPAFMPVPCHAHAVERSKEELRKERKDKRGEKTKREARRDSTAKKSRRRRKASCSGSSSSSASCTSRSAQRPKKVAHIEHKASRITSAAESSGSKLQEPELSRQGDPESWTCPTCDEYNKWERASCNNCYSSRPASPKAVGGSASKSDVAVVANCPLISTHDDDEEEDEEEEAYQQAVRAAFDRSTTAPHDKKLPLVGCKTSPSIILQKEGSSPGSASRGQPPASASSASIETPETSHPPASASSALREEEEKVPTSPLSSASEEVQVVHEELELWLTSLDGGRGGMLQYLPALANFSTNLKEIAAVRERPPDSGQSILDVIRPTFWNDIGVSKQGHKLVIARGLAQLAEKL